MFRLFWILVFVFSNTVAFAQAPSKGYVGLLRVGLLHDMKPNYSQGFGATLQSLHGVQLSQRTSLLAGFEYNTYSDLDVMPLLVALRYNFRPQGISPFLMVEAGGAIPIGKLSRIYGNKGGGTLGLEGGLQIPITKKMAWVTSIGYRRQVMHMGTDLIGMPIAGERKNVLHNLHLRMGFSF